MSACDVRTLSSFQSLRKSFQQYLSVLQSNTNTNDLSRMSLFCRPSIFITSVSNSSNASCFGDGDIDKSEGRIGIQNYTRLKQEKKTLTAKTDRSSHRWHPQI